MLIVLLLFLFLSPAFGAGSFDSRDTGTTPVFQFHFNEGAGTNIGSVTGGNTGTASSVVWVNGRFGRALNFNTSGAQVAITDNGFPYGSSARTLSFWVNRANQGSNGYIFWYGTDGPLSRWSVRFDATGRIAVGLSTEQLYNCHLSSTGWNFVYINFSGGDPGTETVTCVTNGLVTTGKTSRSGVNTLNVVGGPTIGNVGSSLNPDGFCACILDDVQFFSGNNYREVKASYYRGIDAGY